MKDDSVGKEQVILSLESSIPFGHRQTAVGSLTVRSPVNAGAPDLPFAAGASRQRWEHCSLSQGLDIVGWERACISCGEKGNLRLL